MNGVTMLMSVFHTHTHMLSDTDGISGHGSLAEKHAGLFDETGDRVRKGTSKEGGGV